LTSLSLIFTTAAGLARHAGLWRWGFGFSVFGGVVSLIMAIIGIVFSGTGLGLLPFVVAIVLLSWALVVGFRLRQKLRMSESNFPSKEGIDYFPDLSVPSGWMRDDIACQQYRMNAFSPIGEKFSNASVVIYAKAISKDKSQQTFDAFIKADLKRTQVKFSDIKITPIHPSIVAGGRELDTYMFSSPLDSDGRFETVAYDEENDRFLIFALSAKSADAHTQGMLAFRDALRGYRARRAD
jgi:hypothetical protein